MILQTLFHINGRFERGEVEVLLQPGLPQLHIVGLPDASIKECGIKLKSALKGAGFTWPRGQQIIVNLRPSHTRKHSPGVDLAIALGYLAASEQLPETWRDLVVKRVIYGEVALDGRVHAPHDIARAVRACGEAALLTGEVADTRCEGEWYELPALAAKEITTRSRVFDWTAHWRAPEVPEVSFPEPAARLMALSLHAELSVLVAGPQGSGKSTWANALYALTDPPDVEAMRAWEELFGADEARPRWRPLERPHHSTTPIAVVGGGKPLRPGLISRAHGGVLIMDEFLEFHPSVLEALREPMERGTIELARVGERVRWPARFQLLGTTNLCPCGRLNPASFSGCNYSLLRCRSVCFRLSGPLLDRFDVLALSHQWLGSPAPKWSLSDIREQRERMRTFANRRSQRNKTGTRPLQIPAWLEDPQRSHRRRSALCRVARGLADWDESEVVRDDHFQNASEWVLGPQEALRRLFA